MAALAGDADDFDPGCFEDVDGFGLGLGVAEDENVAAGGLDDVGIERGTQTGVKNDAEKLAAAGEAAAVSEFGVVGENGADSGENASAWWRMRWTSSRASGPVTQ